MLRILGRTKRLCDGVTRRELMRVGALSLFSSMSWPRLLRGAANAESTRPATARGPAKSVIIFNLLGGPSHIDMFDMKPLAPVEVRGEFQPIDTSLPGLRPASHPVSPGDVVATIYHLLGIDPHTTVADRSGRPIAIAHGGGPIAEVIA